MSYCREKNKSGNCIFEWASVQVEPDNPAALISHGNVHLAAGQTEAALQLYEDALQADPRSLQALYNVGWVGSGWAVWG